MSDPSVGLRSSNPSALRISYAMYYTEKVSMCGVFISAILYGIIVVLFFRCIDALLNPVKRKKGNIKWGFVAHTLAMFLSVTVNFCTKFYTQSIPFIDNREFPGGTTTPLYSNSIPQIMFFFNTWLADGLLLYRCYVIYDKKYWIIAFPCLMYITSIVTSIVTIFQYVLPDSVLQSTISFDLVFCPTSLALTILLALMIIVRLALHGRDVKKLGSGTNAGKLYNTVVTMFVESYALYALSFIVNIALVDTKSPLRSISAPIVIASQVIAPFFIILRVVDQRHSASENSIPGDIRTTGFNVQRGTTDETPVGSIETIGETPGGHALGVRNIIEKVSR